MSLIAVAVAAVMWSCSGNADRTDANLAEAEQVLGYGRTDEAQSLADALEAETADGKMSASQLGRLSILYMKLNEAYTHDDHDNVAKAVACYRAAFEADADTARAFYAECGVDDLPYSMTLATIVKNIDDPMPWPEEEPDSVPVQLP